VGPLSFVSNRNYFQALIKIRSFQFAICFLFFVLSSNAQKSAGLLFTQNKGQIIDRKNKLHPELLFKTEKDGSDVYLKKTGISYVLKSSSGTEHPDIREFRLDADFVSSNPEPQIISAGQADGYSNYYYAHCRNGITHVKSYSEVTLKNVYEKIDIKYHGQKNTGFEYDIIVNRGGNPDNIRIKYTGAENVKLENGKLRISTALGPLGEYMPKVYQVIDGKTIDVKAEYVLRQAVTRDQLIVNKKGISCEVTFKLGTFNPELPLIIDPWVTYYGGSKIDQGFSVATDLNGNVVFTGITSSNNFPDSAGFQMNFADSTDAFIVKMDASGKRLWATYYGGSLDDSGNGISTDNLGNILVTGGTSSTDFPIAATGTNTVHQALYGGGKDTIGHKFGDAYLLKLDPTGLRLFATYYGGSGYEDDGNGYTYDGDVATDGSNIYLYGNTNSTNAIATAGSFQTTLNGRNVFVAKFTSNGALLWGTYVGGSFTEVAGGITCDQKGEIYIAGCTTSTDFPTGNTAGNTLYQKSNAGAQDAFLFKFDPSGNRLWATYYGGTSVDMGTALSTDKMNNVFLGGCAESTSGIATIGAFQTVNNGTAGWFGTGYVVKFDSSGNRKWGTYLGGSITAVGIPRANEELSGVACDSSNNVIITGDTYCKDFPVTSCAFQTIFAGSEDQFITRFDNNGNLLCSGLLGIGTVTSSNNETQLLVGGSVATYGCFLYLTGSSFCNYPVTPGAFQTFCGGSTDADLSQLFLGTCGGITSQINLNSNLTTVCKQQAINFNSTYSSCGNAGVTYSWIFPGGSPSTSSQQNPIGITYSSPGNYDVKLYIQSPCSVDSLIKPSFIKVNNCLCTVESQTSLTKDISCTGSGDGVAMVTISSASGGPFTYSWSNGMSGVTAASTITLSGLSSGTYSVTVNEGSCPSSASITISEPNKLTLDSVQTAKASCSKSDGKVIAWCSGGTGKYTYSWNNGLKGDTLNNLSAGVYTVTVTDANGCSETSAVNLSGTTMFTYTVSASDIGCGKNGNITVSPVSGGLPPYSYNWSSGGTGSEITVTVAGTYSVTITDQNGCQAIKTASITDNGAIKAGFTNSPAGNMPANSTVTYTDHSTGAITSWLWNFDDPSSEKSDSSDQQNSMHLFKNPGHFCILLTVKNSFCTDTFSTCIEVKSDSIFVPNIFSPNGDGENDQFYFSTNGILNLTFSIYDRWGLLIFQGTGINSKWDGKSKNGESAPDGTYYYIYNAQSFFGSSYKGSGFVELIGSK